MEMTGMQKKKRIQSAGVSSRLRYLLAAICFLLLLCPIRVSAATANCAVTVNKVSTWKQGTDTYVQMSVKINNKEKKDITDWTLKLNFDRSYSFQQGWCAKYTNSGKTMTIKPESYNKTISAKNSVTVGFIVKATGSASYNTANLTVKIGGTNYTYSQKRGGAATTPTPTPKATPTPTPKPKATATPTPKATPTPTPKPTTTQTPLQQNGRLKVKGTQLVNENGKSVTLKGVSTHGINWYPQYVNTSAFKTLRDQWGVQCIRLAMYTEEYNGYCSGGNQTDLKKLVNNGVKYATDLGMYVIIDWHILSDGNPKKNQKEAVDFFTEMSKKYKNQKNVIYEICNEPNGNTSWSDIKSYAETVIKAIRANDKNAVILVGTPTWSQDVDVASKDPIKGYSNLMYTFHFYAATHGETYRNKVETAIKNGLPVFVSEFGISESSGSGQINKTEANKWISFLKKNKISYVCWNLSNKNETSALLKSTSKKTGGFTNSDLSDEGLWFKSVS
jgi:endoglucanase